MQALALFITLAALGFLMIVSSRFNARWRYRALGGLLAFGGVAGAMWYHPARESLHAERARVDRLCDDTRASLASWRTPMPFDEPHHPEELQFVAFQGAEAYVLADVLAPVVKRCVAEWRPDCQRWLDELRVRELDAKPGEVPPARMRTAAALEEALRTHACPKYTPMKAQGT
jgi:hypothetical protein